MKEMVKKLVLKVLDLVLSPFNILFLGVWKVLRHYGLQYFPLHRKLIQKTGVLPVPDHYYQPQFLYSKDFDPDRVRDLGIDWDLDGQLERLKEMMYKEELGVLAENNAAGYRYQNGAFEEGDADLYYLMIRNHKPRRIIEIGSGHSTRVAKLAMDKNKKEGVDTQLICIEPYENPWLEKISDVEVIRKKVEELDPSFFDQLEAGDILFIDSSHIIRPENDVLFLYQRVLPRIKAGVIIHIHDIFSPRHYPMNWTSKEFRMWDEQYFIEIILISQKNLETIFSLNHLTKSRYDRFRLIMPSLLPSSNPSSFWFCKMY